MTKSFPWKPLLQKHPVFSSIHEQRLDALLENGASEEHTYVKDQVIVRQGDQGDSLFVIGSGSAEALLVVAEEEISLSKMGKEDIFGEMAVFSRGRERAATVRAKEDCTILEIGRSAIQPLLKDYPDIGSSLLLLMGNRLRHNNEQILASHLKTVDEKLKLFDIRLDNEERSVEASLKAAQTVFDQTRQRADETIKRADAITSSAERSRDRLTKSAGLVLTFLTILGTLLGWFGLKQQSAAKKVEDSARETETYRDQAKKSAGELAKQADDMKELSKTVNELIPSVEKLKDVLIAVYRPRLLDALGRGLDRDALEAYRQLKTAGGLGATVSPDDDELPQFLTDFERHVVAKAQPPAPRSDQESSVQNFVLLIQSAVLDAPKPREKLDAYYLLLVYAYLTDQSEFRRKEGEYENLATRQAARAALEKYVKSTPFKEYLTKSASAEEMWRAATRELADRIKAERGKRREDLRALSDRAYVKLD